MRLICASPPGKIPAPACQLYLLTPPNVVVSAAFWPKSEDRRCLALLARRKCRMAVTEGILREYRALTVRIGRQECPDQDPLPFLDWIEREEAARAGDKWAALLEREENDPQAR